MSKSAFNIRRLISQRRPQTPDGVGEFDSDGSSNQPRLAREGRKESWFVSRRSQGRKPPPTPIIISSPQLIHNVFISPLPPLPHSTRRSSESSVCSCEKHEGFSRFAAVGRISPLCSVTSKDDRSEISLQPSSATSYGGDEDYPQWPLKDNSNPPRLLLHKADSSSSTLDLMEALSLGPEDKEILDNQHIRGRDSNTSVLSDSVHQLIEETDEAFKAVGSALAEPHIELKSFNETPRLPPLNTNLQVLQYSKPILGKRRANSHPRALISPVQPPRRISSASRVQRNRSQPKQMKPQRKSQAFKQAAKNNSRWTLGENVSELFTGKLFHKVEADEMLTPNQIEAYKLRRLSRLRMQTETSSETFHTFDTESTDTPIEPFHMDDLPSRIGFSGVRLTANTPDEDKGPSFFNDVVKRDFSLEKTEDDELFLGEAPRRTATSNSTSLEDPAAFRNMVSTAHQSIRSPGRYMFRKIPELPTISETAQQDDELFLSNGTSHSHNGAADADYVYLTSSPHTLTMPRFRHGRIRLAKSDLYPDFKLGGDDGLDWTAFQMAILGGAGDYFSDSEHTLRQQETEDIEAIRDWWDEWSFDSCGTLVTREEDAPSPTSTLSGDDSGDYLYSDIGNDNPYSAHHRWSRRRREAGKHGRTLDLDLGSRRGCGHSSGKLYNGGGIKKWSAGGQVGRESLLSMPQSPMMDVQVVQSDSGDVDYVPMGYNLSHDLGDFLTWEAEHVYSDGKLYEGGFI